MANINYLKIKDQIFSGNNIFINGDFMVTTTSQKTHKAEEKKIAAIFKLNYTRNTFFVEQIKILEQSRLNAVIKELLKERTYSLNEIFEYIQQNLPFYDENILTDTSNLFCEQLEEKLVTNNNIQINNCEEGTINISKRKSNEISINYQIDFDEYQITNIVISDKDIQSEINKKISEIQTNEFNFIEIVSSIIYYIPEGE
ncbi:hypothetical protein KKG31_03995 [Patescibacteria group bacterium]|nr:hypothetical protein [Patescibacteria group bacterium]MBU1758304.1 hypothetical protein [Patescibacteria group bacterium]